MSEIWKPIADAPDYDVSSLGRVRRARSHEAWRIGLVMKQHKSTHGYPKIRFWVDGGQIFRKVHRLVCIAFHGHPPTDRPYAAHKDGNRENNAADNLYWASPKENSEDAIRHGRLKLRPRPAVLWGASHPMAKLSDQAVREILATPRVRGSGVALAAKFGVTPNAISYIRNDGGWKRAASEQDEAAVYIVIRRDLKMRRGKEIAQGVHAMAQLGYCYGLPLVVVQAADLEGLNAITEEAQRDGVKWAITCDAGRTEVDPGTITAAAVGPVTKGALASLAAASLY